MPSSWQNSKLYPAYTDKQLAILMYTIAIFKKLDFISSSEVFDMLLNLNKL